MPEISYNILYISYIYLISYLYILYPILYPTLKCDATYCDVKYYSTMQFIGITHREVLDNFYIGE